MKRIRIVPIAMVLLLAAGGVWWLMNFERVSEQVYVGLKGAARDDPYLALRMLFKRSNLKLEEPAAAAPPAAKFDNLPAGGTLLLGDRRHVVMTAERIRQIVAWVNAGGHLIVEAEYPGRPDPLLTAFGVTRRDIARPKPVIPSAPTEKDDDEDRDEDDEKAKDQEKDRSKDQAREKAKEPAPAPPFVKGGQRRAPIITEVLLPDGGAPLKVEFRPYQNLEVHNAHNTRAYLLTSDSVGLRFATGAHGAGRVSVMSNFDFLIYRGTFDEKVLARQPTHIGKHDHAEMMVRLVRLNPNHAKAPLRLVWGNDDVSLWKWLYENAPLALASLALLIAVWIWRVVPRFGPLTPDAAPAEQKLSSHLEAVGRFYWKHMAPGEIYARMRTAFVQRLSERRPGIAQRAAAERNTELAQLAGVRAEAVARALDLPANSVAELIRNAVLLQRLSEKL